jgi:hypothetical protein
MPGFADNLRSGSSADAGEPPIVEVRRVTKQFGRLVAVS